MPWGGSRGPKAGCHGVRWSNVIFLESTRLEMHVNISVTVKTISGISLFNGGKLEESKGCNYFFRCFLCVRLLIDQLFCVIC